MQTGYIDCNRLNMQHGDYVLSDPVCNLKMTGNVSLKMIGNVSRISQPTSQCGRSTTNDNCDQVNTSKCYEPKTTIPNKWKKLMNSLCHFCKIMLIHTKPLAPWQTLSSVQLNLAPYLARWENSYAGRGSLMMKWRNRSSRMACTWDQRIFLSWVLRPR